MRPTSKLTRNPALNPKRNPKTCRTALAALLLSLFLNPSASVAAPETEVDVAKGIATLPPFSSDRDGTAKPKAFEGLLQGRATTEPGGPDGEAPFQDPKNPNAPPTEATPPDLSAAQVLELSQLSATSDRPFSTRIDNVFAVPASLRGSWVRPETNPKSAALGFVGDLKGLFQFQGDVDSLAIHSVNDRLFTNIKLQQEYRGLPVFGAELLVHTQPAASGGTEVRFVHGTVVPGITVNPNPSLGLAQARNISRNYIKDATGATVEGNLPAYLTVFNMAVLDRRDTELRDHLAWHVEAQTLSPPGRWTVLVDAHTGAVLEAWNQSTDIHPSQVLDMNTSFTLTDDVLWYEDGVKLATGTAPADAADLEDFGDNLYDWLLAHYGIDSLDDAGMQMLGRTNDPLSLIFGANAYWDGVQASFTPGMATQDVVGHEFGHAIVEFLGGDLIYQGESGALNEAHADIFGEYLDCQNGSGCNWEVGQDSYGNLGTLGIIRDMSDPPAFSHPDHYDDFLVTTSDNGGVHTNSGILNKFGYLIAEGDTHRGVTVNGIGVNKAGYVVINTLINTGLTSSATYFEYGDVLVETCETLIGDAVVGEADPMSDGDCRDVQRACYAVGICPLTQADGWGLVEAYDRFGYSLATGDFDNDGYDDLAAAAPFEDRDGVTDAGTVNVFYGTPDGIGSGGAEVLHQGVAGTTNEDFDYFGYSLAVGDIDADGYDDLIVGSPHEDLGAITNAGWIFTFFGSSNGLLDPSGTASYERISQASAGTISEDFDYFGWSLASGDIDGDGYDDVAIGCPYEDWGATVDSGRLTVLYGASGGLRVGGTATFEHLWQDAAGAANVAQDLFGWAVTVGDIDGDGYDDAVASTPWKDFSGGITNGGWIYTFLSSSSGLLSNLGAATYERLSQDSVNTPREDGDQFGYSLLLTDIDGDGYSDLVAGTPHEDFGTMVDGGWIIPIYGTANGLRSGGTTTFERISQSSLGTTREAGDLFGFSLASGDWNGDGNQDVVASSPYEGLSGEDHAGWVIKVNGSASGLLPTSGLARWSESSMGGVREAHDHLGYSVAVGDFDGDGDAELATGAPDEDSGPINSGAVFFHE